MAQAVKHQTLFKNLFIYLFLKDPEREAETQAEGEAGSMQGVRRGTRPQVSRITPWAEGGAKPLSHSGCPILLFFFFKILFIHERQRKRGRDTVRGRSRLHAGSPTWDSILGLQDQALG